MAGVLLCAAFRNGNWRIQPFRGAFGRLRQPDPVEAPSKRESWLLSEVRGLDVVLCYIAER